MDASGTGQATGLFARVHFISERVITMAAKVLTINEISERISVSPRTIRKVLRANFDETPGRGGRYAIAESDIPALVEMVKAYTAKTATVLSFPKA
jgi:DeoR/GlpR family transcriptional regulator of sugar metabolism